MVHEGQIWAGKREMAFVFEAFQQTKAVYTDGLSAMARLSPRETEVFRLIAEGLGNREISVRLRVAEHTVKNYVFHIFEKLGVSSRVELLILYAMGQRDSNGGGIKEVNNHSHNKDVDMACQYQEAVERGVGVMQFRLGEIYRNGVGVSKDDLSAYVWFSLAEKECFDVRKRSNLEKTKLALILTEEQICEAERRVCDLAMRRHQQSSSPSCFGTDGGLRGQDSPRLGESPAEPKTRQGSVTRVG
jgi:DNA-binding CsgD family transcriptional regulator